VSKATFTLFPLKHQVANKTTGNIMEKISNHFIPRMKPNRSKKLNTPPSIGKPFTPILEIMEKYSWLATNTTTTTKQKNRRGEPYNTTPNIKEIPMAPLITRFKTRLLSKFFDPR
jgi:hypothetical protein